MTKTLTEQWKDWELPEGEYFAITTWSDEIRPLSFYGDCFLDTEVPLDNSVIVEVLAPVPSYDEYCNLVFQANKPKNPLSDVMMCYDTEREKKVVERLQEQLKEAQNLIIYTANGHDHLFAQIKCEDYMHKYHLPKLGVK